MARIASKAQLTKYIREQLGDPLIRVEVTDNQIWQIIDDAVQYFTEYAYGVLQASMVLTFDNGIGTYDLPDNITNVIKLSKGGRASGLNFNANFGGMVPDVWSEQWFSNGGSSGLGSSVTSNLMPTLIKISNVQSMLEKYLGDDLNYNFNYNKKQIQVFEDYREPTVLWYEYEYLANDEHDFIFNHEFIKAYTVAKTRYLWGNNTGKFDQTLVGGARINYSDMKNEAQQELDRLHQQLIDKWSDPAPIDIF